jgi:tRNA(Ile)-lysidine synthase
LTAHQKKVKLENKYLKDPKIKRIYLTFKKQLYSQIRNEKFCIGVSGGPDSLALTFLGKIFSKEFNTKFIALIVDHNLRKQSAAEARKVKKILIKHKIRSKILTWKGKIPKSNIQFNARNIRYFLLNKQCSKLNIKNLVLAHHEGDLIENFFIRLFRGSGLKGLSSLNIKRHSKDNILNLIRPLIHFS